MIQEKIRQDLETNVNRDSRPWKWPLSLKNEGSPVIFLIFAELVYLRYNWNVLHEETQQA